jgi:cation transport protein ChaC
MSEEKRRLRLTAELAAIVGKNCGPVEPGQPPEGRRPATDDDHRQAIASLLAGAPPGGEVWVFAYGSLIWNPEYRVAERRPAMLRGYHPNFCLGWDRWFRGSTSCPGLMLALDRGGQCSGIAHRLDRAHLEADLLRLMRREMRLMPHSFPPRWVTISTPQERLPAFAFVVDRKSAGYVGGLSEDTIADTLATAVGKLGSMAEYLHDTVTHLEAAGLHDRHLWRLQEAVAERIERANGSLATVRQQGGEP